MLKEYTKILRNLSVGFDLLVILGSYYAVGWEGNYIGSLKGTAAYYWLLPLLLLIWSYLLYHFGLYNSFRTKDILEVVYIIFKAAFFGLIILSGAVYFLKPPNINRNFIALLFMAGTFFLYLEKILLMVIFRLFRRRGYNYRNILLVGSNKRAQRFIDLVKEYAEWGLRIIGIVEEDVSKVGQIIKDTKIIGTFKDIPEIMHNNVIDEVIFIVPRSWLDKIKDMLYFCETEGIKVSLGIDLFDLNLAKAKQTDLHGFPLLTFESAPDKIWHLFIKRTADMLFSGIGLLLLAPIFIIVAVLIKLTSSGPVFFKQLRSGQNGRKFNIYKFKTMINGAEDKLSGLLANNEMNGPVFKMKDDPRITPAGRVLRKLSIDELPQLWNVLKGDMSLVGPRPGLPSEVDHYDNWQRRRLSMRPGITCIWQIGGRNKITDFDEWMHMDLQYIDNWSLWLDLKILLKTIPVVVFGIGAK